MLKGLEAKLKDTEKQFEKKLANLRSEIQGSRVAFGASISNVGNIGPYNTEITLLYRNVYFNSGSYNPATGIFTAPVRGVYYFSFSGHNMSSRPMGLRLMKNGEQMVTVYNHPAEQRYDTGTNGMTLQLAAGDQVYMRLRPDTWIHDNNNNHSTFIAPQNVHSPVPVPSWFFFPHQKRNTRRKVKEKIRGKNQRRERVRPLRAHRVDKRRQGAAQLSPRIFTAPVRGVYYFSFSGHNISTRPMGLRLMKNGEQMVTVYNHAAGNRYETATNDMTLQLAAGDQVYMRLRANTWIYDNNNNHSTFIGHLLFPL
uniref:C1q domain-containing protein n=1 Tax=Oreochromis niloticus TaxID=8128 RepID=I3JUU3_ORENI